MKKQQLTTIIIHDAKTGNWELNKIMFPLNNQYTPGLSTIKKVEERKTITISPGVTTEVLLTSPGWLGYIKFGLQLLFWKIVRRLPWTN